MKTLLLTPPARRLMNPSTFNEDMLPPKTWIPLGIAYLAGVLRENGFEAHLQDLHDWEWDRVERLLADVAPDLVGISCFTFGRTESLRLAALARKVLPEAAVVMGGPHATLFPEQMLGSGVVDVVVLGQGEDAIVELAEQLGGQKNLSRVKGIAYYEKQVIRFTPPREHLRQMDDLPFPAYDAFDVSEYKSPEIPDQYIAIPGTHLMTSRGCPFHCRFCSVNRFFKGKWAVRSPKNVVDELEWLVNEHGIGHVYFSDDLFSLNHARTVGICKEIIRRGVDLAWMAETRVDCVNEEMLRWMRQAGCHRVYYGLESGSPSILRSINKGFTVEQVRKAFKETHQAGLDPCCFLMVGNPGETPETIAETVDLVREIKPASVPIIGITTILPGTDHYELALRQGLINDEYWLSEDPPPLYTGEHDVDDLIYLQLLLTKGVCPEVYEELCGMGLDDSYFRLRRMVKEWS